MSTNKFIRSVKHTLKFSNKNKRKQLNSFIREYKRVANLYIDYFWNNTFKYTYTNKNKQLITLHFNSKTKLDLPDMLSTIKINKKLSLNTFLTARAQSCCMTQILGILRGVIEEQRKRQYIINKFRSQSKKIPKKLRKKAKANRPAKPNLDNLNPELHSICIDFKEKQNNNKEFFNAFVQLKCFSTKSRGLTINFPIKYYRNTNKWRKQGKRLNSFLINNNYIEIRYEIKKKTKKKKNKKVGADQGKLTVLTLSDTQTTPKIDNHKHSLDSILEKMSRKKKDSKAFKKTQEHRKNFINWSINQLNFSNITEIGFEKVKYLKHKRRLHKCLTHWTYTEINDKMVRKCEEEEVLLVLQSSIYKSQRCSNCGLVRKSQRKGKVYACKNCGLEIDADLNASLNHQQDLPDIPYWLRRLNINRVGFFWKTTGFYDLTKEELTVPLSKKVS